jgi:hypothetical protein
MYPSLIGIIASSAEAARPALSVEYVVVAGGGAGGPAMGYNEACGGGGAGGILTGTLTTLSTATNYTTTVGAGGAGSGTYAGGSNGSN